MKMIVSERARFIHPSLNADLPCVRDLHLSRAEGQDCDWHEGRAHGTRVVRSAAGSGETCRRWLRPIETVCATSGGKRDNNTREAIQGSRLPVGATPDGPSSGGEPTGATGGP